MKEVTFISKERSAGAQSQPQRAGLYDAAYEHDSCGVGMIVDIHGN